MVIAPTSLGAATRPFSLALMLEATRPSCSTLRSRRGKPHLIERLLDYCREQQRAAMAQIEAGAHRPLSGNLHQGPDVVSPRHYRRWAFLHQGAYDRGLQSPWKVIAGTSAAMSRASWMTSATGAQITG